MKKIFAFLITVALCVICSFGAAGCKDGGDKYKVFVPDGAPAIALSGLYNCDYGEMFDVSVVNANTINTYVTGKAEADFAVLPINAAVKLLGSGEKYKMLGTVTHGNLFLLKKQRAQEVSSAAGLSLLVGKTVGVASLANFPGLIFKIILADNNLAFNELKDGANPVDDKINLIEANNLNLTQAAFDYTVRPEPAASALIKASSQQRWTDPESWTFAASLQELYGGDGYPQAVAVAKTSVIENDAEAAAQFMAGLEYTQSWLADENTTPQAVVYAVDRMTKGDLSHTFTEQNLTKEVLANCGIRFERNQTGKAKAFAFMTKLNAVSDNGWKTPADGFFY